MTQRSRFAYKCEFNSKNQAHLHNCTSLFCAMFIQFYSDYVIMHLPAEYYKLALSLTWILHFILYFTSQIHKVYCIFAKKLIPRKILSSIPTEMLLSTNELFFHQCNNFFCVLILEQTWTNRVLNVSGHLKKKKKQHNKTFIASSQLWEADTKLYIFQVWKWMTQTHQWSRKRWMLYSIANVAVLVQCQRHLKL